MSGISRSFPIVLYDAISTFVDETTPSLELEYISYAVHLRWQLWDLKCTIGTVVWSRLLPPTRDCCFDVEPVFSTFQVFLGEGTG